MDRYFDKRWSQPAFFISLIIFVLFTLITFPFLPDQIISNSFNLIGSGANSPKLTLLLLELIFFFVYLLIGYGSADFLIKFNPDFINIPNKEFWIDPLRVELTVKKVSGLLYWILFITNILIGIIFFAIHMEQIAGIKIFTFLFPILICFYLACIGFTWIRANKMFKTLPDHRSRSF